jgi:predicted PhzF superfamily epimerase YddE/YHI9
MPTTVHVLRVFTDPNGNHGNPLGVVLDATGLDDARRQAIAAQLGFSETVFVENVSRAELRIFTPTQELPLAGHPLVGASWLLSQVTGAEVPTLRPLRASAEVDTWLEDGLTWIRARIDDAPPWAFVQLDTPADIEALSVPPAPEYDLHEFWAWQDEAAGRLRARVFVSRYGIAEDEATGSGAIRLIEALRRPFVITQGRGSILHARPAPDASQAEIGGLVVQDEVRQV